MEWYKSTAEQHMQQADCVADLMAKGRKQHEVDLGDLPRMSDEATSHGGWFNAAESDSQSANSQ